MPAQSCRRPWGPAASGRACSLPPHEPAVQLFQRQPEPRGAAVVAEIRVGRGFHVAQQGVHFTGNTEQMAKAIEEGIIEAGGAVDIYKANAMDKEAILSSDVIVMGSSATGAEVIDENDLLPFMEESGDKFKGKKVYIFGSLRDRKSVV